MAQLLIVVFVVAAIIAAFYFRKSRSFKPAPPAPPEQEVFGLDEAEQLVEEIGGLNPQKGLIIELAANVGGLRFTVREEAAETAAHHTNEAARYAAESESLRARAQFADSKATANAKRAAQVSDLAANFGVKK